MMAIPSAVTSAVLALVIFSAGADEGDVAFSAKLDREVRSLQRLQTIDSKVSERARAEVGDARTSSSDLPSASEDSQVGAAWIAKALLEEENKELRQELAHHRQAVDLVEQRRQEATSFLSQGASISNQQQAASHAAHPDAESELVVNALRGIIVSLAAAAVLGMCCCGGLQLRPCESSKSQRARLQATAQRYGSVPAPVLGNLSRYDSPAGVVDDDEEQLVWFPSPQTRAHQKV
eukprot:TRINITY_DN5854_c0_g1_i2.p1 TRINITY_DN5854_c0_g1~~TRINITY_DN5854_c0_g1_i2.p1  ORF type:complete len:235 (+),score=41.28 TRINITY_DN5854_c0_g1_i2:157-861(+)